MGSTQHLKIIFDLEIQTKKIVRKSFNKTFVVRIHSWKQKVYKPRFFSWVIWVWVGAQTKLHRSLNLELNLKKKFKTTKILRKKIGAI